MDNPETSISAGVEKEIPQQSVTLENNPQFAVDNVLPVNNDIDPLKIVDQSSAENQISLEVPKVDSQNEKIVSETDSTVSTNDIVPPLPPLPKDDKETPPQTSAMYSADYNSQQNYANYNYMYNYNNYYGYPYPQYQWDYSSQQYYQPYQNYYNYNYNANQTQTSKPPPPPSDAVQLPVEEKPANKTVVDDSNRYSPTAEIDDDDTMKGVLDNNESEVSVSEQPASSAMNSDQLLTVSSEQIEIQQNKSESVTNMIPQSDVPSGTSAIQQPVIPLNMPIQKLAIPSTMPLVQQPVVPTIAQLQQPYTIPVQQHSYLSNPQIPMQMIETGSEVISQQKSNSSTLNGKDDSVEKVPKTSTVLGKNQAKKRLMAFSMMKQKLQEQNNSNNDNQTMDAGEGNDVEFVPELNVFQTVPKKKVVANKKVVKVIKAQQTIEQIEEMKKDEILQGNNAALYQHLLRSGGNEAPILQKLGIESLAEKYSAKIREQDKRLKRHHHRRRDDNRRGSQKYRRRSHSKSRSRSRSTEKPKMRALEVKCWKDFVDGKFHFDKFRRFKLDEAEEIKEKERKSRSKKRHSDSRLDSKSHNRESLSTENDKGNGDRKSRYNILDRKKEILKGFEVCSAEGDFTKDFPSNIIQYTKTKPVLKYSQNPAKATCHLQNRQQMFATLLPEIEAIVHKFLLSMKPKKLKENTSENYNVVDENLLAMMKDKNIYPFKGWWPKKSFIVTQVKEDPNIEIDKDALINEFTTSKRIKKSRFNDDTSLVDLRPTVPSKWDSDYDGSPIATDKIMDVEVPQKLNMDINSDIIGKINSEVNSQKDVNTQGDISNHKVIIDTTSDGIGEDKPKIEVNVSSILSASQVVPSQESQGHAKLDTEYENFLKIVSAEKLNENVKNEVCSIQKDNDKDVSVKSISLNNESEVQDESEGLSSKSSDESVSLNNSEESNSKNLSSLDGKTIKKKTLSNKRAKKLKKKENKKKKQRSSSSSSSQDTESDNDSSSSDTESESSDSTSPVEKKKKKKKSKDKKKKKSRAIIKKKQKTDKCKTKKSEDEKDSNSSILNLLEKAFNVEIKKRPLDGEEPKQKKKKRKHEKKENEENEVEIYKIKECLKETFTKLAKTDKDKSQSLSYDDSTVNEVFKYLKMNEEKEKKVKKSKKSSKRKYDSDDSDDEMTSKKCKPNNILQLEESDKKKKSKKKKSVDSDEHISKKKSKKKSKTTDTSGTEDGEGLKYKKSKKDKDSEHFFGLRPNEWNIDNKSSRRGVVHHSDVKNRKSVSSRKNTRDLDSDLKLKEVHSKCKSPKQSRSGDEKLYSSDNKKNMNVQHMSSSNLVLEHEQIKSHLKEKTTEKNLVVSDENITRNTDNNNVSKNIVGEKLRINLKNSDNESEEEQDFIDDKISNNSDQHDLVSKHKTSVSQPMIPIYDCINKQFDQCVDINPGQSKPSFNQNYEPNFNETVTTSAISISETKPISETTPIAESLSHRDKVKMNLKKLSTSQFMPFVGFGFSSPLSFIKPNKLEVEKISAKLLVADEEVKPKAEESKFLQTVRPKVVICPQSQQKKPNVTQLTPAKIDMEANHEEVLQRLNWEGTEESSDSNQFSLKSNTVVSVNLSKLSKNEQIKSSSLNVDSLCSDNRDQKYEKVTLSNDNVEVNVGHKSSSSSSSDTTETSSSGSESEEQEQSQISLKVDNINVEKDIIPSLVLTGLNKSEQLQSNTEVSQNHSDKEVHMTCYDKDSDSLCSQYSNVDLQPFKSNNELITQWQFDWSELDKSVDAIRNPCNNYGFDDPNKLQMKPKSKKSRWDAQPKDNMISKSSELVNESEVSNNKTSNSDTNKLESEHFQSNFDECLEQNQTGEISSINCINDGIGYNYSDNWYNECDPQSYEQYSCIPQYSEMKTIENDELNPVDYSIYENYNPNYTYHDEDYAMWKSTDETYPMATNEASSIQVVIGNVLETSPSYNISNDIAEFAKDETFSENVISIMPSQEESSNEIISLILPVENEIVEADSSISNRRNEKFFQLYQQHFKHYSQNPIQYSMSNPDFNNLIEISPINVPGKITAPQEISEADHQKYENIPIPLRARSYSIIIQDNNSKLFITSDNYLAYVAVEDRCMVHIATESSRRDGIEDEVRHCFNINQNGLINEYWLHADLIPFHVPSDVESGVFSDDDESSVESDSGREDDINDNLDNQEWDIVESDSDESINDWLNDPSVINKYGENYVVEQTVISQEDYVFSSSEYDTDMSDDFSDSYDEISSTEEQNTMKNYFQKSLATENGENIAQNINDVMLSNDVEKQYESNDKILDLPIKTEEKPLLSNHSDTNLEEDVKDKDNPEANNDFISKLKTENINEITVKLEINENEEKEPNLNKEEVEVDNFSAMSSIIYQKLLIQKLKICSKQKVPEKLPDTDMVSYSDNMEIVKYPFLGLFQPPTISILSKQRCTKMGATTPSKRVTFADGTLPGYDLSESSMHDDFGCPLSPPPLKALMRETLKMKRNIRPFRRSKVRTRLTMVNNKVAAIPPSVQASASSVIEYYISRRCPGGMSIEETLNDNAVGSDSPNSIDIDSNEKSTPPRPKRETTPVPSDIECWNDEDDNNSRADTE